MPWVRIDDEMPQHPKIAQAGPLALAMQVAGLCYSNRHLTDGFIPLAIAKTLLCWTFLEPQDDGTKRVMEIGVRFGADRIDVTADYAIGLLVESDIWYEVPGGYQIHDYEQYQPLRADVLAEKEKKRSAGQAGGKARAQAYAKRAPSDRSSKPPAESKPNPTPNPNPTPKQEPGESDARAPAKDEPAPADPLTDDTCADERDLEEPEPAPPQKSLEVLLWEAWEVVIHGGRDGGEMPLRDVKTALRVLDDRGWKPAQYESAIRVWLEQRRSSSDPRFDYFARDIAIVIDGAGRGSSRSLPTADEYARAAAQEAVRRAGSNA